MQKLMLAALAAGVLVTAPASAQVYFGAGPGGVGAQVAPFGFGVGPQYDYYYGRDYGWYGSESPYETRSFAYVPRHRLHRGGRSGTTVYQRPNMKWDPYAKRWDGGN
jgi:hypothetical protein